MRNIIALLTICCSASFAVAQDAKDLPPIKPIPRVLPPKGVDIGKDERDKLEARLAALTRVIKDVELDKDLGPDVEIYTKAVRWALDFDEFYDAKKDIAKAYGALDAAKDRLNELLVVRASWTSDRGLLVRGYRSDIDGSVQPYGLHIPQNLDLSKPVPLLVWLHGRGDKETDLHFIATREKSKGEFAPDWCITLHPYGRGTIGFKFAGEIDVLDAIESVKKRYKIDEDRIALAGFSMGGAGAWHVGAHYADKFCVVHCGAGFVETAKYNKLTPDKYPAWYEQKLWGWYDVPCYTRNLFNVPVIAYSGENDKQKQAADLMAEAFKAEGRELRHVIGPGVEHKYEAKAKEQVLKEIKAAVDKGRDRWPKKITLQTRTARYAHMAWVRSVESIFVFNSWAETRVDAELVSPTRIEIKVKDAHILRLSQPWKELPAADTRIEIVVNDNTTTVTAQQFGEGKTVEVWTGEGMQMQEALKSLRIIEPMRESTLAGPIDDAFMSPFIFVLPSQKSSPAIDRWVDFESKHAIARWRALFRGDPRVKMDVDVTEGDPDRFNLILWGDRHSNRIIKRAFFHHKELLNMLWEDEIQLMSRDHVFIFAIPNPFVPRNQTTQTYFVLNSGPTFREGHDRTNSQQTPKLPDWAIIGLGRDPDGLSPGQIKAAGFFDEGWKMEKAEGEQKK